LPQYLVELTVLKDFRFLTKAKDLYTPISMIINDLKNSKSKIKYKTEEKEEMKMKLELLVKELERQKVNSKDIMEVSM
jgi:hypothetical protein